MRVLVVGGCGFIGSHLVESLCGSGFEVEVWDDLSSCWLDESSHVTRPRWLDGNARFHGDGLKQALPITASVAVWAATQHPLHRNLIDVHKAQTDAAIFSSRCVEAVIRKSALERVVVLSSERDRSDKSVGGVFDHILGYVHRPPHVQLRRLLMPEVYGPRQLPGDGPIASVYSRGYLPQEYPNIFPALPISEAIVQIAHHITGPNKLDSIFAIEGRKVHAVDGSVEPINSEDKATLAGLEIARRFYGN